MNILKIIDISKLLNQKKNKINTFQIASITHQFLEIISNKIFEEISSILIFNKYSDIRQSTNFVTNATYFIFFFSQLLFASSLYKTN